MKEKHTRTHKQIFVKLPRGIEWVTKPPFCVNSFPLATKMNLVSEFLDTEWWIGDSSVGAAGANRLTSRRASFPDRKLSRFLLKNPSLPGRGQRLSRAGTAATMASLITNSTDLNEAEAGKDVGVKSLPGNLYSLSMRLKFQTASSLQSCLLHVGTKVDGLECCPAPSVTSSPRPSANDF